MRAEQQFRFVNEIDFHANAHNEIDFQLNLVLALSFITFA